MTMAVQPMSTLEQLLFGNSGGKGFGKGGGWWGDGGKGKGKDDWNEIIDPEGVGNDRSRWGDFALVRFRLPKVLQSLFSLFDNGRTVYKPVPVLNTSIFTMLDKQIFSRFRRNSTFASMDTAEQTAKINAVSEFMEAQGLSMGEAAYSQI